MWSPQFECVVGVDGEASYRVGHVLVDEFLEFIAARARPNTVKAYAHDLKVFFTVVAKEPAEVTSRDVLGFVTEQRRGRAGVENVVRITDGSAGLSAATIKRRLAAVSALYGYLVVRGDAGVSANPVRAACRLASAGATARRSCRWCAAFAGSHGSWVGPVSTGCWRVAHRPGPGDRPGDAAGGVAPLRGPRVAARGPAPRRVAVFVAHGKGGHERLVPMSTTFFTTVAAHSTPNARPTRPPTGCSSR
jgi:hypothetical protein